jgi:predicted transcriptional regulator
MNDQDLLKLTSAIVASYLETNKLDVAAIPDLLGSVHNALRSLEKGEMPQGSEPTVKATSAQIRRSIRPEGLISFLDGKTYRLLRRHLTTHDLTPDQYRERFGLPATYPLVAPDYSAARSDMAKASGLGRGRQPPIEAPAKAKRATRQK